MLAMAEIAGSGGMPVPRICRKQTARSSVEASTPEEYWRRPVFVPYLDHLIQEFEDQFSQLSQETVRGCYQARCPNCLLMILLSFFGNLVPLFTSYNS